MSFQCFGRFMAGGIKRLSEINDFLSSTIVRRCQIYELSSEEVNGRDRKVTKPMQHQQVIESFINKGTGGRGVYVKAGEDVLYSQLPSPYRPYGRHDWSNAGGRTTPLAVRLKD